MKTKTKITNDLAALKGMTPKQLRERYAELYGEPSRSGNKQWLIRRCAWRIQALAEGGLSERAERRARQLARDQDLRVIPPKDLTMDPLDRPADVQQPTRRYIRRTHDARLPMPGEQITRVYKRDPTLWPAQLSSLLNHRHHALVFEIHDEQLAHPLRRQRRRGCAVRVQWWRFGFS